MSKRPIDYRHIAISVGVAAVAALVVSVVLKLGLGRSNPLTDIAIAVIVFGGTYMLAKQDIQRLWRRAVESRE